MIIKYCYFCGNENAPNLVEIDSGEKISICNNCRTKCIEEAIKSEEYNQDLKDELKKIIQSVGEEKTGNLYSKNYPPFGDFPDLEIPSVSFVIPNSSLSKKCSFCGIDISSFLEQKYPGCPCCFYDFKNEIIEFCKSIKEKKTEKQINIEEKIHKMEKDKFLAVKEQRYLDAAKLRDKINKLKEELKDYGKDQDRV